MSKRTRFSVIPTYSAGSPAQVDQLTAERVAVEEQRARTRALDGMYGEKATEAARRRGLAGIAYAWTEKGKGAVVTDLVTQEVRTFRKFDEFQQWGRENRIASQAYRTAEFGG